MGEIQMPSHGPDSHIWSSYMVQKFTAVVEDWILRVEAGDVGVWYGTNEPISTEHLRIAKAFLKDTAPRAFEPGVMTPEEVNMGVDAMIPKEMLKDVD